MALATFDVPGHYDWTVPPRTTRVKITTWGAGRPTAGHQAIHDVVPGQVLRVRVGGSPYWTTPGYNGGGPGTVYYSTPVDGHDLLFTTTGYGASDVRTGGDGLADRIQAGGGAAGAAVVYFVDVDDALTYGFDTRHVGYPGGHIGPFDPVRVIEQNLVSGGIGGAAPGTYPAVYGLPIEAGEFMAPGAGGGGWGAGDSGEAWFIYNGGGPPFGDPDWHALNYYHPTRGVDGDNGGTGTLIDNDVTRDDWEDLAYWNQEGRVDIEWEPEPGRGWSVGHMDFG